ALALISGSTDEEGKVMVATRCALALLCLVSLAGFVRADDGLPPPRRKTPVGPREQPRISFAMEKGPGVNDETSWSVGLEIRPDGRAQLRASHIDIAKRDGVFDGKLTGSEAAALQKGYDELVKLPEPEPADTVIPLGGVAYTIDFPDVQGNM